LAGGTRAEDVGKAIPAAAAGVSFIHHDFFFQAPESCKKGVECHFRNFEMFFEVGTEFTRGEVQVGTKN
jgi:hypothetical protein